MNVGFELTYQLGQILTFLHLLNTGNKLVMMGNGETDKTIAVLFSSAQRIIYLLLPDVCLCRPTDRPNDRTHVRAMLCAS
jgi:hypothetical protein